MAYGLQFHLEADATLAARWNDLPEYAASLARAAGPGAIEGLVALLHERDTTAMARALISRWVDTWERDDERARAGGSP
jgi:hypothetical protein